MLNKLIIILKLSLFINIIEIIFCQMCPKHGTDFLEYKCRYCCSVAVFFCFGTTHFCNACHDDFQRVTNIPKTELPHCPAGEWSQILCCLFSYFVISLSFEFKKYYF